MAYSSSVFFLFSFLLVGTLAKYKIYDTKPTLDECEYHKNVTATKTFKEFIRLVDKHNLNVSVIVSSGKNYDDDNLKEVTTMTITMPVNEESITKATLDKVSIENFAKIANEDKITMAGSKAVNNHMDILTNNREGLPINRAYKIFTGIKNGKTGFVLDEKNYDGLHTFIVKGADGKNQTTQVYNSVFTMDVVKKTDNIKDDELKIIKQEVVDGCSMYDEDLIPKGIATHLGAKLPGKTWNVAYDVGKNSFIESETSVLLCVAGVHILVYSC